MRTWSTLAVLVTANAMWMGCGGAASSAVTGAVAVSSSGGLSEVPSAEQEDAMAVDAQAAEMGALPLAPWADAPLAVAAVPAPILAAWQHAENRAECAPIAPTALGAGDGANPRVGELEGGWAVEFDQRGMPGADRDGAPCARCGRGVFGIAGTNLVPEDLVTEESLSDLPPASFADGSHLSVEPPVGDEDAAAAVITVRGQGCVYQVWSFLGEEHVRELVSSLRLVEVARNPAHVAAR